MRKRINQIFHVYLIGFLITLNILFYVIANVYAGNDWSLPVVVTLFSIFPICYSIIIIYKNIGHRKNG
jgi:hypothetical protein